MSSTRSGASFQSGPSREPRPPFDGDETVEQVGEQSELDQERREQEGQDRGREQQHAGGRGEEDARERYLIRGDRGAQERLRQTPGESGLAGGERAAVADGAVGHFGSSGMSSVARATRARVDPCTMMLNKTTA